LGGSFVKIHLVGSNFDESYKHAAATAQRENKAFVHPFDDQAVIEGQGTVGVEIMAHFTSKPLDYLILPIGGGGLCAGVSSYVKAVSPHTKIIGVEPLGAPSMYESIKQNKIVTLQDIDTFVDGAAVKRVGTLNYPICKEHLHSICLIDEGHVCSKIIQMYNEHGLIIEPAGVLSLCALDQIESDIKGKTVVTVISGGNSDAFRMPEILERALIYEGRKHYFRIEFPQKAGALKHFIMNMLGPNDDIIYFRYTKLINKESGPVILGIETKSKDDIKLLIHNMEQYKCVFTKLKNV
jgi:threonine dehydratase